MTLYILIESLTLKRQSPSVGSLIRKGAYSLAAPLKRLSGFGTVSLAIWALSTPRRLGILAGDLSHGSEAKRLTVSHVENLKR